MPITIAHSGLARLSLDSGEELLFTSGANGHVLDIHGRSYIDFVLGYGSVIIGHNVPGFSVATDVYANNGLLLPGYTSWHRELLTRLLPDEQKPCTAAFFKTGSESVTAAIRLSTALTSRMGVLRCGFIGWHDVQLGRSVRWHEPLHSPLRQNERFVEAFRGISGTEAVYNWTTLDTLDLAEIIDNHGADISCIVVDTYQAHIGGIESIARSLDMCRSRGIRVIADETKLAGRVSRLGLATMLGWEVDFRVIGKALANGAPLSILVGDSAAMMSSESARITGTFSQEVGAIYAALATYDVMERQAGYTTIKSIGAGVISAFNEAAREAGLSTTVAARPVFEGSMFELSFEPPVLANWAQRQTLCGAMADAGVLLLQGHPCYVCLAHAELDIEELRARFLRGLTAWSARNP